MILTFYGCFKDNLVGTFYLTEEIKNCNPYIDGSTVTFIDNSDNKLICNVYKHDTIEKYLYSSNSSRYYLWEKEVTRLRSDSLFLKLTMSYEPNREPLQDIYVGYKGNSFYFVDNELPINYSTTPRLPSIQVNGVWYYQVYYFENDFFPNSKIYYSTEFGVLRVEFENGEFLDFVGE